MRNQERPLGETRVAVNSEGYGDVSQRNLRGIVPALLGRTTAYFEKQIEEAMEDEAVRIVDNTRAP